MKTFAYAAVLLASIIIGPTGMQAQWVETNGPPGGSVHSFAVSDTNLFAGTDSGVFLSVNNGISWNAASNGLPDQSRVTCFAATTTHLFAGTDYGVFLTTNNGRSWTQAASTGLVNTITTALAVSGTALFASPSFGLCRSTDNGGSWTVLNSFWAVECIAVSGADLLIGNWEGGVSLSHDNGTIWNPAGLTGLNVYCLAINGTDLFAGTDGGVYLSTNNGADWTSASDGIENIPIHSLVPSGANIFAGTNSGVFLSTNHGTTWASVNTGLTNMSVSSLVIVPASAGGSGPYVLASTLGRGVFSRPISEMLASTLAVPTLASPGIGSIIPADSASLRWNSVHSATSYRIQVTSDYSFSGLSRDSDSIVDTSVQIHGLSHATKYYWRARAENRNDTSNWSEAWEFQTTQSLAYLIERASYYPLQTGDYWEYQTVTSQESSPNDTSTYYVEAFGDTVMPNGYRYEILYSTVNGTLFERVDTATGIVYSYSPYNSSDYKIDSLLANPNDRCNGLTCYSIEDGVLFGIPTHLRTMWTGPVGYMNFTYYYYAEGFGLYGVYKQFSSGNTVTSLVYARLNGIGYIAKTDTSTGGMARAFTLSQNYPNPFNNSTFIPYTLPNDGYATLSVYDVLGRKISTLVSEMQTGGDHKVEFRAGRLSSGVYFYRLQSGSYSQTKKLVVLK